MWLGAGSVGTWRWLPLAPSSQRSCLRSGAGDCHGPGNGTRGRCGRVTRNMATGSTRRGRCGTGRCSRTLLIAYDYSRASRRLVRHAPADRRADHHRPGPISRRRPHRGAASSPGAVPRTAMVGGGHVDHIRHPLRRAPCRHRLPVAARSQPVAGLAVHRRDQRGLLSASSCCRRCRPGWHRCTDTWPSVQGVATRGWRLLNLDIAETLIDKGHAEVNLGRSLPVAARGVPSADRRLLLAPTRPFGPRAWRRTR